MDKDRVEGKAKDIKGRIKRQVGEWTGDEKSQSEGAVEQAKGKIQNAWGKAKDTGRDILNRAKQQERTIQERHKRQKEEDSAA